MVSIMRRRDTMESQTIECLPMMACHRGDTETPMPFSGIVGKLIQGVLMTRAKNCPRYQGNLPWYPKWSARVESKVHGTET